MLGGDRIENPSLRLGVFTQDLAQELDVTARAVDLVTAYARSGEDGDINISDEQARSVLGGLGLTGDKSLRKVGELSGGEKVRGVVLLPVVRRTKLCAGRRVLDDDYFEPYESLFPFLTARSS